MKDRKCTSDKGGCFLLDKLNLSVHPTNINDEEANLINMNDLVSKRKRNGLGCTGAKIKHEGMELSLGKDLEYMLMSYLDIVCPGLNYGLSGYAPRVTFMLTETLLKGFCGCKIRNYRAWTSA